MNVTQTYKEFSQDQAMILDEMAVDLRIMMVGEQNVG
jgi:hypothetical protein